MRAAETIRWLSFRYQNILPTFPHSYTVIFLIFLLMMITTCSEFNRKSGCRYHLDVYMLLWWASIPALVGLIEGILLLVMSVSDFNANYGNL
jgi:hypothetical protein